MDNLPIHEELFQGKFFAACAKLEICLFFILDGERSETKAWA